MSEQGRLCQSCKHADLNRTRDHPVFASVTQFWCEIFNEFKSVRYCTKYEERTGCPECGSPLMYRRKNSWKDKPDLPYCPNCGWKRERCEEEG